MRLLLSGSILELQLIIFTRQDCSRTCICLYRDFPGKTHEREPLWQQAVIFHRYKNRCCIFIKNIAEIDLLGLESHRVDREAAQNTKLHWQDLIGADDLDGNPDGEFLMRIARSLISFLANQELGTSGQNRPVRLELQPNCKTAIALYIAQSRIELEVRLEVFREEQLYLHGVGRPVKKRDLLSIELVIDEHI